MLAYLEAIDAMEKGRGAKVLEKKLGVAYQERMRYFANRIAQTELHRAWMDKQAAEIMADEGIEVVQFQMSGTHPRTDICDLYASQDAYGLGPGLYPKEHAPLPPLHPHCRCGLISKRLISAKGAKENPDAGRQYLRQVMREGGGSEAAKVMGSRAKLDAVLNGSQPVEQVVNIHRPAPYRLGRAGDVPGRMPTMSNEAFEIAKSGGRHGGTYRRYQTARTQEIEKSIRSINEQISQHEDKVRNPKAFFPDASDTEINYLVNRFWPKEINNLRQQRDIMVGILSERDEA